MENIPRRCFIEKRTKEERAIDLAIEMVENLGADPKLTDSVVLLGQAKDKLSDYVDSILARAGEPQESWE